MKKLLISIMIFCGFFSTASTIQAKGEAQKATPVKPLYDPEMNCTGSKKLTWTERKRLDQIYKRIYNDYSDLIYTYSKAGVLTPYQTKIRYVFLNNYIKTFYKRNYQWCSEHEDDEWEEEWYNNDND